MPIFVSIILIYNNNNNKKCAFCSKVFVNVSYLQAHIARRHSDISNQQSATTATALLAQQKASSSAATSEIEKELERVKERLRLTENELLAERSARIAAISSNNQTTTTTTTNNNNNHATSGGADEMKQSAVELTRQKDELKRAKEVFKQEIYELNKKNQTFERTIRDLEDKLGKQSHVGWLKDDIDIEKDTVLKQRQDIQRLTEIVTNTTTTTTTTAQKHVFISYNNEMRTLKELQP